MKFRDMVVEVSSGLECSVLVEKARNYGYRTRNFFDLECEDISCIIHVVFYRDGDMTWFNSDIDKSYVRSRVKEDGVAYQEALNFFNQENEMEPFVVKNTNLTLTNLLLDEAEKSGVEGTTATKEVLSNPIHGYRVGVLFKTDIDGNPISESQSSIPTCYPILSIEEALDRFSETDNITIKVDDGYKVKFKSDGSVRIGCTTLSFEEVEKIYNQAQLGSFGVKVSNTTIIDLFVKTAKKRDVEPSVYFKTLYKEGTLAKISVIDEYIYGYSKDETCYSKDFLSIEEGLDRLEESVICVDGTVLNFSGDGSIKFSEDNISANTVEKIYNKAKKNKEN